MTKFLAPTCLMHHPPSTIIFFKTLEEEDFENWLPSKSSLGTPLFNHLGHKIELVEFRRSLRNPILKFYFFLFGTGINTRIVPPQRTAYRHFRKISTTKEKIEGTQYLQMPIRALQTLQLTQAFPGQSQKKEILFKVFLRVSSAAISPRSTLDCLFTYTKLVRLG